MNLLPWSKLRDIRHKIALVAFENADNPRELWEARITPLQHRLQIVAKGFPDFDREIKSASYESANWQGWSVSLGPSLSDEAIRLKEHEELKHDRNAAQTAIRMMLSKLDAILAEQPSGDLRNQILNFVCENHASIDDEYIDGLIARELGVDLKTVRGHLEILAAEGRFGLIKVRGGYSVTMTAAQLVQSREGEANPGAEVPQMTKQTNRGKVFVGHGRSLIWREFKDFLEDKLGVECVEFNTDPQAGNSTKDRLEELLDTSCFAFLIHTAEDEHVDGTVHPRENVIHETGLFQGRLGFKRAIILLERGCNQFTNIHGITHIPFGRQSPAEAFEPIRDVLKREQIPGTGMMVENRMPSTSPTGETELGRFGLSCDEDAKYLMELSRPRNNDGAAFSFFDSFPEREREEYRDQLEAFCENGLMRKTATSYVLTAEGYDSADQLWRIAIMCSIHGLQENEWSFVDADEIGKAAKLDEASEILELQRHLKVLQEQRLAEVVPTDAGIAAAQLTHDGRGFIRPYLHYGFCTFDRRKSV